jgi:hypothetical protein
VSALRLLAAAWLLLTPAACQPLPQPFAEDRPPPHAPILTLKDSAGVVVAPVAGAPAAASERLAEAMADGLRQAEIPAGTSGGNRASFVLAATAEARPVAPGRSAVALRWELRDAAGQPVGGDVEQSEVDDAVWAKGGAELVDRLVRPAVARLAALMQDDAPNSVAAAGGPVVLVREVAGAPGDGSHSLQRAMNAALRQARVALAAGPTTGREFVIAGRVELAPPLQGQQRIKVSWAVQNPDGSEIGLVNQENAIAVGSLDGPWGDVAYIVATAAVDGVIALLEKARAVPNSRS